jgi:hypothetical protein
MAEIALKISHKNREKRHKITPLHYADEFDFFKIPILCGF